MQYPPQAGLPSQTPRLLSYSRIPAKIVVSLKLNASDAVTVDSQTTGSKSARPPQHLLPQCATGLSMQRLVLTSTIAVATSSSQR